MKEHLNQKYAMKKPQEVNFGQGYDWAWVPSDYGRHDEKTFVKDRKEPQI